MSRFVKAHFPIPTAPSNYRLRAAEFFHFAHRNYKTFTYASCPTVLLAGTQQGETDSEHAAASQANFHPIIID